LTDVFEQQNRDYHGTPPPVLTPRPSPVLTPRP